MNELFYLLVFLLAAYGTVELATRIAQVFLPVIDKSKPMVLWLTGSSAEYKLRRIIHNAALQQTTDITVICLDSDSEKICRIFEQANPWLDIYYDQMMCRKCN